MATIRTVSELRTRIVAFATLLSALLLLIIPSLTFTPAASGQGKGGEVIAKPTPKKTATPHRTSSRGNSKRSGNGNTSTRNQREIITNRLGMEFVWIPPGSFMMGSEDGTPAERPVHRVTFVVNEDVGVMARIEAPNAEKELATARRELERESSLFEAKIASQAEYEAAQARYNLAKIKLDSLRITTGEYGFYMGKYEVTQSQWQQVMGNNPSQHGHCGACPVEEVSWEKVQVFLDRLNDAHDGYRYRLPTEAEWEYACRAGTTRDDLSKLDSQAWYERNSNGKTHPVGQLKPNAFGFYDMRGNVGEWCLDWYHDNYDGAPSDGTAWSNGGIQHQHILRGGSYNSRADRLRSAARDIASVGYAGEFVGFRVVAVALTPESLQTGINGRARRLPSISLSMPIRTR